MPQDGWNTYIAHRIACVRERIHETERLMRPPTPQELVWLQKTLQRLKEQEAAFTRILATALPTGLFDP